MSVAWEPLRFGPFRALGTGLIVTTLGNAIAPVALAFAVLDLTGSLGDLGLVVGARTVANVAFVLFGGVLADRLPRRPVLVWSTMLAALTQGLVASLVITGAASMASLLVLSVLNGIASAFAMPCTLALLPQTVPARLRRRANSIVRVGNNLATVLGASAGAGLVAVVGPGAGLAFDAATFVIAGGCFALIRVRNVARVAQSSLPAQLREGWTEFCSRSWVWVVVLAFLLINASFGAYTDVLGPFVANATFGRGNWGLVVGSEGLGLLCGALIAMRLRASRLLLVGCATMIGVAVLPLGLAFFPTTVPLMVAAFLGGVGMDVFSVAWDTSLQQHIPEDRLARVYSYDILGSIIAIPLAQVAVAPAAAALGVRTTLLICSGLVIAAVLATVLTPSVASLRQLESAVRT